MSPPNAPAVLTPEQRRFLKIRLLAWPIRIAIVTGLVLLVLAYTGGHS